MSARGKEAADRAEVNRIHMYLAGMPRGMTTASAGVTRKLLLSTDGKMFACGGLYSIKVSPIGAGVYQVRLVEANVSQPGPALQVAPSAATINALPEPLRSWVHDLETRCDPAGDLRRLRELEAICLAQEKLLEEYRIEVRK